MDSPVLWYLNRGTGAVTLVLLTLTLVLGLLSPGGRPARGVPRFVTQQLHRNLAMLSVVLLVTHIVTAVVDSYVDIRWWQAVIPVGATYQPLWLGLGAVSVDLFLAVFVTSLLRNRFRARTWRLIHQLSWPMWAISLAHGLGIGTDLMGAWFLLAVGCLGVLALALAARLARLVRDDARPVSA